MSDLSRNTSITLVFVNVPMEKKCLHFFTPHAPSKGKFVYSPSSFRGVSQHCICAYDMIDAKILLRGPTFSALRFTRTCFDSWCDRNSLYGNRRQRRCLMWFFAEVHNGFATMPPATCSVTDGCSAIRILSDK